MIAPDDEQAYADREAWRKFVEHIEEMAEKVLEECEPSSPE